MPLYALILDPVRALKLGIVRGAFCRSTTPGAAKYSATGSTDSVFPFVSGSEELLGEFHCLADLVLGAESNRDHIARLRVLSNEWETFTLSLVFLTVQKSLALPWLLS